MGHYSDCRNRNATRTFISSNTYLYRQQPLIPSRMTLDPGTPITDDDDEPILGNEILCPTPTNSCAFDMFPNNRNNKISSFGADLGGCTLNNTKYATNGFAM